MAAARICVLRAPGTNCDVETEHALRLAGGEPERVHLFRLLEEPGLLSGFQMICIPGGFSYGDDVG
ncbi:MAG: phosphoribosylformylglycinamidine synthase subunit PurQ, partial [Planctomycetaceae bacterium]|nr:phosphoribosylformylglycinamidine synthase subunit PurQ [Planctomycetaceae bacterium]